VRHMYAVEWTGPNQILTWAGGSARLQVSRLHEIAGSQIQQACGEAVHNARAGP